MEVEFKFREEGLELSKIMISQDVTHERRTPEEKALIAATMLGAAKFDFFWTYKLTPMNHGVREHAVSIGLCSLTYDGGLNMPPTEFDLTDYSFKNTYLQRSKNELSVIVVDDVKLHMDDKFIEFIFSI